MGWTSAFFAFSQKLQKVRVFRGFLILYKNFDIIFIESKDTFEDNFSKRRVAMSRKYVDNVCAMLRRKGLSEKYECAGIYCIKLNE